MAGDLNDLSIALDRLSEIFEGSERMRALYFIGEVVGTKVEEIGVIYPPSPAGRPQPFKTDKQRRFFFAALTSGEITVPYVRTGNLARALTHSVSATTDSATVKVGTTANVSEYADLVIGDDQSFYHEESGWEKLGDQIEQESFELDDVAQQALDDFMDGIEFY